jgi:hypothetical protein
MLQKNNLKVRFVSQFFSANSHFLDFLAPIISKTMLLNITRANKLSIRLSSKKDFDTKSTFIGAKFA